MDGSGFYTGKGDRGTTTRLGDSQRVDKASALIEAVGALDETTSAIGVARAHTRSPMLQEALLTIQQHLYRLLSHLSATPEKRSTYQGLSGEEVAWLEALIARIERQLPTLREFVLPGDSVSGAAFHVARTVARRAERRLVAFFRLEPGLQEDSLAYVNRLSSLLFVAALSEDCECGHAPSLSRE